MVQLPNIGIVDDQQIVILEQVPNNFERLGFLSLSVPLQKPGDFFFEFFLIALERNMEITLKDQL